MQRLKALKAKFPSPDTVDLNSHKLGDLLAEAEALIGVWNKADADDIKIKSQFLHLIGTPNYIQIVSTLTKVIHQLEIEYPQSEKKQVYAAGEAYDFYSDFKTVVLSAKRHLFLIDPYINEEVSELYVKKLPKEVACKVLLGNTNNNLKTVIKKLHASPSHNVEVRTSKGMHDRVMFIDDSTCWLIGQSIKDAAKKKPTYFVELPDELVHEKMAYYSELWSNGESI
jgi:hypothetical protein